MQQKRLWVIIVSRSGFLFSDFVEPEIIFFAVNKIKAGPLIGGQPGRLNLPGPKFKGELQMKKQVFIFEPLHEEALALLAETCRVKMATALDQATLIREVPGSDGIIVRALERASAEVMDAAGPGLKVVARHGVGVDNIDLEAAAARGIKVVNSPHGNTRAMAEHFVLLALAVSRKIKTISRWLESGDWSGAADFSADEMSGRTLGILGFGNIGQAVAKMASAAFDMPVIYASRQAHADQAAELGAQRVSYEELFARSDFVAVCQALTPETRHLVRADLLNLMKPTAYIINLSRGGIWNEADLLAALTAGRLAGAATDVFETEPMPAGHPLLALDNFVGTPHIGALTGAARRRNSLEAVQGVLDVLAGREPQFRVV